MKSIRVSIPISRSAIDAAFSLYENRQPLDVIGIAVHDHNFIPVWTGDPGPQSLVNILTIPVLINGANPVQIGIDPARERHYHRILIGGVMLEELYNRCLRSTGAGPFHQFLSFSTFVSDNILQLSGMGFRALSDNRFPEAIHILIPQIEAFLRAILKAKSITTGSRRREGVIMEQDLGGMLRLDDAASILGKTFAEWLYTLYIAKEGGNLRNDLSHGLISIDRCGKIEALQTTFALMRLATIQ